MSESWLAELIEELNAKFMYLMDSKIRTQIADFILANYEPKQHWIEDDRDLNELIDLIREILPQVEADLASVVPEWIVRAKEAVK